MAGRKKNEGEGISSLQDALNSIAADYGEGTVVKMSETPNIDIEVIPTGIAGIDVALGRGGLPRGRVIEVYGPESSGKTTLALNAVAQAQKQGLVTAYIDAEHALDPEYAEALGVDVDSMYLTQPNNGEQALEIADRLVRSNEVGLIVVDSVAALVPRAELQGEMGDAHVGLQARMMSQALRKISGNANQTGTTIIFINQLREKIGVMFGSPETTTGGKALKFYASIRIDVRATEKITEGKDNFIGNKAVVKIIKNKVAPPFKRAELENKYGIGFDRWASLTKEAKKFGVVEGAGAWIKYKGESMRPKDFEDMLKSDPEFYDALYAEVMEALKNSLKKQPASAEEPKDEEFPPNVDPSTGEILDEEFGE